MYLQNVKRLCTVLREVLSFLFVCLVFWISNEVMVVSSTDHVSASEVNSFQTSGGAKAAGVSLLTVLCRDLHSSSNLL